MNRIVRGKSKKSSKKKKKNKKKNGNNLKKNDNNNMFQGIKWMHISIKMTKMILVCWIFH